ncbi:MAG TPA: TIGR03435 family protein, partial [Terriglobia bacterium]|nr:TIGR03435 family protein [Terriglobia bacterium]
MSIKSGAVNRGIKLLLIAAILAAPVAAFGQTKLEFEVATVKPAPPLDLVAISQGKMPRVGVNVQGTRVDIGYSALSDLIATAYKVKPHQVSGADWMKTTRFDIQAKMPDGSNKDQMPEMLQALLAERFGLKIHKENRDD